MPTEDPDSQHYLAVLKASYDYAPQSDDEVAIKEGQLLLLVERVDEDWWKIKVKGESQDDEGPLGLVPAAYVEQAEHTSLVKVIYEYEPAAPGELAVKEDEILRVFETEGDWILAQSHTQDGGAGYVPGNYVEATSDDALAPVRAPIPIVVPESPPAPRVSLSNYEDPAVRVQSHKLSADDIKTWSVSELDKKGKKKKGTLGIGNGSLFFASESDKAAVQKWQTSDVTDVFIDKPKHVRVTIGGINPTDLHFHAGTKDNAEEIRAKVQSSKAISTASSAPTPSMSPSPPKPSVHFSAASPIIIPPAPHVEEEEEEPEEQVQGNSEDEETAMALYDFKADGDDELSVTEGEQLLILERDGDEWWKCRNAKGTEGVVPAQYLELQSAGGAKIPATPPTVDSEDEDQAEEESNALRLAQEEEERSAAEQRQREAEAKARKKLEAQQKAKAAAAAAEVERQRRKESQAKANAKIQSRPETNGSSSSSSSKQSGELTRPPPETTRTWRDRSGQFSVDAAFLGFSGGKLRLHKTNGVVVEVPAAKMSVEDMRYVERFMAKKQRGANAPLSDEDVPLAVAAAVNAASGSNGSSRVPPPPRKGPKIDWFDFFLSAGCDIDDCTRYTTAFEKDKIDETILADVTDSTMRSLGLKEGDIIRVKKAIEKRKPNENLSKPSPYLQEQLRRDEELAKQLQAQESSGRSGPAPNLFSGPGGVLKNPRRGRPQPNKSLPLSNVDIKAIDTASETIRRTASPQSSTPISAQPTPSNATHAPPRSSSALAAPSSGFEDDAWTPRPSSTKPLVGTPPPQTQTPRAQSVPPPPAQPVLVPTPNPPMPGPTATTAAVGPSSTTAAGTSLAKTTESDVFEQLARLSALRQTASPVQPPPQQQQFTPQLLSATPSIQTQGGLRTGMGISHSPLPLGHLQTQVSTMTPPPQQPYNGPRGPFAPVPSNQSLLQPLIPTHTGFTSFVPTRPTAMQNAPPLPMQNNMLQPNMGGGLSPPPQMSPSMVNPQFTGMPMNGGFSGNGFSGGQISYQPTGFGQAQPLQPQFTSFNGNSGFNGMSAPPPVPPMPPAPKDNSPANIFASMKSGTFENDQQNNNAGPRPSDMYDALRTNPAPIQVQPTGWGQPTYGMGFQR